MSIVLSYSTVGMTDPMNFRKISKVWWGFIFFPLFLASSMNFFKTSECLQGCTVRVRMPVNGWGYYVTVWLIY